MAIVDVKVPQLSESVAEATMSVSYTHLTLPTTSRV